MLLKKLTSGVRCGRDTKEYTVAQGYELYFVNIQKQVSVFLFSWPLEFYEIPLKTLGIHKDV
jgi:hypothetical protein